MKENIEPHNKQFAPMAGNEIMSRLSVEFADSFGNKLTLTDYSKRPDLRKKENKP